MKSPRDRRNQRAGRPKRGSELNEVKSETRKEKLWVGAPKKESKGHSRRERRKQNPLKGTGGEKKGIGPLGRKIN